MIKTLKKSMALVLAVAMVFSVPTIASAADATTLVGPGWDSWASSETNTSADYGSKDGVAEIFIESATGNDDIVIEAYDSNNVWFDMNTQPVFENDTLVNGKYTGKITAGAWMNPALGEEEFSGTAVEKGLKHSGDIYKVSIKATKSGSSTNIEATLTDTTTGTQTMSVVAKNTTLQTSFNLRVRAVYGTIKVYGTVSPTGEKTASDGATTVAISPATTDDSTSSQTTTTKKKIKLSKVKTKKNAKKITGQVSVKKATVKIAIKKKGKKKFTKFKKATVKGKKFTFKTKKLNIKKLTKGSKVKIKVTKSGYKTLTKTYKVK